MEAQDLCYCLTGKLTNYFYVGPLAKNLRSQFKCSSRSRRLSDPITDVDKCPEKNYTRKIIYLPPRKCLRVRIKSNNLEREGV